MVRGPGIGKGVSSDLVTSHTDLASTFLELAGAKPRNDLDGSAIPLTTLDFAKATEHPQEHVNIEMWGIIKSEGKYGQVLYPNHTYKALRVVGESYNLLYTVWCSNEHELYDLSVSRQYPHALWRELIVSDPHCSRIHTNRPISSP